MRGVGGLLLVVCVCVVLFPLCVVSQVADNSNTWIPTIDLVSATSARLRFLPSFANSYTAVLIQYQNTSVAGSATNVVAPSAYHASAGTDSRYTEINVPHTSSLPITSYILRQLQPSSSYYVQIGYIQSGTGTVNPTAPVTQVQTLTTTALSSNVALYSLYASGGCGYLSSSGTLYYLTFDTANKIYSCVVPYETSSLTVSIIPAYAYATITNPSVTVSATNATVASSQVDPLVAYNATFSISSPGSVYNLTWTVTAENGATQLYTLSITRAQSLSTAQLNGPSSPVTAFINANSTSTALTYHALLWSSAAVGRWLVWSDDQISFPFSSLNITFLNSDKSLPTVLVTPAYRSTPIGSCSNVNVALYDNTVPIPRSITTTTCISAVEDACSSTPYGAATKWQNPFTDGSGSITTTQLYFPAPPYTLFPAA